MNELVYIDEHDLFGINYYWNRMESYRMSEKELNDIGFFDDRVQVHKDIIAPLQKVDQKFQERGYRLYVKEGYRPKALYELAYKKRVEKYGKEDTDRLLNMNSMPHANGKSVDVTLWNPQESKEVYLRNGEDGADALFIDFYKGKTDEKSKWYREMQEYVIGVMQDNGFRLGKLNEYFHFDFRPVEPRNYPS